MAFKSPFTGAVEKKLPSGSQSGDFNGKANPSDGGSDLPLSITQYTDVAPAPAIPYTVTRGPIFKINKGK